MSQSRGSSEDGDEKARLVAILPLVIVSVLEVLILVRFLAR